MASEMNSQTSDVTCSDLSGFVEQEEISSSDFLGKEPMSSEWTDEKHSLYLNCMEASFVDQLYRSMDLSDRHSEKNNYSTMRSSKHTQSHTRGRFKVHGHGCWQINKFGRGDLQSLEEFTDQNFEEDNEERGTRSLHKMKKIKAVEEASTSKDQVVPFGTSHCSSSRSRIPSQTSSTKSQGLKAPWVEEEIFL